VQLARLPRAGGRTRGDGPTVDDEAIRDLTRAREAPRRDLTSAQFRLKAGVPRQEIRAGGRATWSPAHLRWRSAVVCPTPAQPPVLPQYVRAVHEPTGRLQRLAQALPEQGTSRRLRPVVDARQAPRGVPFPAAVPRVAAIGDLTRSHTPRALPKCVGLPPSAYPAGEHRRQGAVPTAGDPQARRGLAEGAWASRSPAHVSRHLQRRRDTPPKLIRTISWTAPVRRCQRDRPLVARGTPPNVVTVAMARARPGFLGAMATQVPITPDSQKAWGAI
jgi:transposase